MYGQEINEELPRDIKRLKSRIMYVENKSGGLIGPAKICKVYFSKTGKTIYFEGRKLVSLKGRGFKANYFDIETGEEFWISGVKKRGGNRLYGGNQGVVVDPDAAEELKKSLA